MFPCQLCWAQSCSVGHSRDGAAASRDGWMGLGAPWAGPCHGRGGNEVIFKIPLTPNHSGTVCEPRGSISTPLQQWSSGGTSLLRGGGSACPSLLLSHKYTNTDTSCSQTNKTSISHSCSPGLCCNSFGSTSRGQWFWVKLQRPNSPKLPAFLPDVPLLIHHSSTPPCAFSWQGIWGHGRRW